jgi:hypothetical protein
MLPFFCQPPIFQSLRNLFNFHQIKEPALAKASAGSVDPAGLSSNFLIKDLLSIIESAVGETGFLQ